MYERYRIIDVSQPVSSRAACFPGDPPSSRQITVSYQESNVINLTAITMSPHVGTHADAPVHVTGDMHDGIGMAASLPLEHYFGPAVLSDFSHLNERIIVKHVAAKLAQFAESPRRILFKTSWLIRHEVFEEKYAYFSVDLIEELARRSVIMMGIDTPSVDYIHSKTLDAHHALLKAEMCWLENLDLTQVEEGEYFLVALPLKL